MIQSIKSINRSLSKSRSLIAPFPALTWVSGDKPISPAVDHYRVSNSWDGIMTAWRISPEPERIRVPLEQKPRMWFSRVENLYHCQLYFVRGSGTTRRHAWHDLQSQLRTV